MPELSLTDLAPEQCAVVTDLALDFAVRERLAALGMRVGRRLRLVRRIGKAGPMQVRVDHTDLILRVAQARRITVSLLPEGA